MNGCCMADAEGFGHGSNCWWNNQQLAEKRGQTMARTKRLYRAIAWYRADDGGEYPVARHYQSKRARDNWVKQRLEGYPEMPGTQWDDDGAAAIPPALRVEIADSLPIIFPED